MKQLSDVSDQLEQTCLERNTFDNLRQHEIGAIPKRMEVSQTVSQFTTEKNRSLGRGGRSSVVRESEFKSKDPGIDPMAGQGCVFVPPSLLLCRLVCA